ARHRQAARPRAEGISLDSPGEGLDGAVRAVVPGRCCCGGRSYLRSPVAASHHDSAALQLTDVFRAAHAKFHQASPPSLFTSALAEIAPAAVARAGIRESVYQSFGGEHEQRKIAACGHR